MRGSKYEALEQRIEDLEKIIDDIVSDLITEVNEEDEHITILPYSIVEEMEKIVKHHINVIGIT